MKKVKILLIALILIIAGAFLGETNAADVTRFLGAQEKRPFETESKYQYFAKGTTEGYTVFKIYDKENRDFSEYTKPIYCLRGGRGFGANDTTDVSKGPIEYIQEEQSEMHENAENIIAKYNELYGVNLDRDETINDKQVNIYNAILWILDESYLPKDKLNAENKVVYSSSEYKQELLDKAGVPKIQQEDITDNDLEVIQQLAIWYFTNYDEQQASTIPTVSQATMYPAQFLKIDGSNDFDKTRGNNLNRIYQYFVYGAIDNSSEYTIDGETGARTRVIKKNEFDKTKALTMVSNDDENLGLYKYYKIGPVKVKNDIDARNGSRTIDTTDIVLYDAQETPIPKFYLIPEDDPIPGMKSYNSIYRFVDKDGQEVTSLQTGIEYYIRFYKFFEKGSDTPEFITEDDKYDMSKITIRIKSSYTMSTATFMYAKENARDNQAVVEIDKEKISEGDEITTRVFDLALRKFITAIKRENSNVDFESRVPKINTNTLIDGIENRTGTKEYTATYTHSKTPLKVQKGDKVTYTIRIYNEGEIEGTATSVTDYLPEGLKLADNSAINSQYGWTNPTNDGKTIVTEYLKDIIIKPFDKDKTTEEAGWQKADTGVGGLYYADLQVECEVIASESEEGKTLRNIAAITEDTGDDRDSVPGDPGRNDYVPPTDNSTYKEDDDDYEDLELPGKRFDLALRKYITKVERNNQNVNIENERKLDNIDITKLVSGEATTAEYKHRKDPVEVEPGDIVTYTFGVYNEGDIKGIVTEIIDYLPAGIEFDIDSNTNFIEYKESYTEEELQGKEYAYKIEDNKITILPINKDFLFELDAFNGQKLNSNSVDVKFKITAEISNKDKVLTNVATMKYTAVDADINDRDSKPEDFTVPTPEKLLENLPGYKGNESNQNNLAEENYFYKGQEDDDDFEKVIIKGREFDLSLRKYISAINGEELENSRVPQIDTSKLNTIDESTGKMITTATYKHPKDAVTVKKGDLVTYKIRIYNEGKRDGYATRVTDYLPEGLGFLYTANGDINSDWFLPEGVNASPLYGEKGIYASEKEVLKSEAYKKLLGENVNLADVQVIQGKDVEGDKTLTVTAGGTTGQTEIKATDLIKAYKSEKTDKDLWQQSINDENDGLFYQELEITCIVLKENTYPGILKNVAEITEAQDSEGNEIKNVGDDRDSEPNNVYEDGKHTPGTEVEGYTPGEQDDDDYEPLQLKYFDLALRKFITKVDDKEPEETREPKVDIKTLIEGTYDRNGKLERTATYTHPKDPLLVKNGSVVEYTIRVYNEGTEDGYAYEVSDDIPEGLVYDPDNTTNKEYGWKMYREVKEDEEDISEGDIIEYNNKKYVETTDSEEATMIRTRYLDKTLIKGFNSEEKKLDYADVKVVFIVDESKNPKKGTAIVNQAQITEDSGDDEDSTTNEWKDEDDEDIEKVRVPIFDLSLLKWVTKTIVTVDGKTTTTETGFKPNTGKTETTGIRNNEEVEPIAKVEVDKKKINNTVVKFAYKIRITNEGEIAGYATEITDFIPEGLEFKEEDNKTYGWTKEGDKKVTTRALETVLLQPGESVEVEIIFTWKNGTNNLGLKTNIAEITEDYNEYNTEDIDSTPDNKKDPYEKEQEDDDDFALVILSIKTGKGASYMLLTTTMLTLLAGGIYLVKRYVLTY